MKTYAFLPSSILLSGLLLSSCGTAPGKATEKTTDQIQENKQEMTEAKTESHEAWREERDEALKELRDLRNTFENERARNQERLDKGIKDAKKKKETEEHVAELNKNIARIDASMVKLEASTGLDWNQIKGEARQVADDTKSWWDRQKEAVDRKTDADKDHDGH